MSLVIFFLTERTSFTEELWPRKKILREENFRPLPAASPVAWKRSLMTNQILKSAWLDDTWCDPDPNPKILEKEERETLSRQGRCWACRGSCHRDSDSVCSWKKGKKLNVWRAVEVDSSSESEWEKSSPRL